MEYYISKTISGDFESVTQKVKDELMKIGFGVLTEVNLHEKFKEKLGKDFRKYLILGACNPKIAYEALGYENKLGTMLPCSVVVQQISENEIEVAVADPVASMMAIDNDKVKEILTRVKASLKIAFGELS